MFSSPTLLRYVSQNRGGSKLFRSPVPVPLFIVAVLLVSPVVAQEAGSPHDKKLDVRSSVGDLHLGDDADARRVGLPLYPGARPRHDEDNNGRVNLGILTESFGVKLVVAKYDSDDAPEKIVGFYRDKLKKYGKVLECHTHDHGGDVNDHDDRQSKELKCEGDDSGPVTELKVGTEDNQHMVAVEPRDKGAGSTFALVYLHVRGKEGEI
jgi:hypothetical protein